MESANWKKRLTTFAVYKALGNTIAVTLFFVAYFYLLNHPAYPVREAPLLPLDGKLPILDWSAWVYFSLWVYIGLPAALLYTLQALRHYLYGALVLAVCGLSVFFLFPTAVPHWPVDWSQYPVLEFLKSKDNAGNAFPSMHVAYAVFAAFWLNAILHSCGGNRLLRWLNLLWCIAIILSTITTRQHVWVDVIGGILLALLITPFNLWWSRKRKVSP
ncbi:MAG: phosphatase PAP2 family protein [Puniceicoccales bacterium]